MNPAIIAALIQGGMGLLGGKGKKGKFERYDLYTPEQKSYMDQALYDSQEGMSSGIEYLNKLLSDDPEAFADFEAPFKRQFEEETMPGIAERFSGADAQGSSAFGQTLGQAGGKLSENLAALRAGLKSQAMQQLQGVAGMGLKQQFGTAYQPGQQSQAAGMAGGAGAMGMEGIMKMLEGMDFGGGKGRTSSGYRSWIKGLN